MKKKLLYGICLLLYPLFSFAQKEANFWYFYDGVGLDFSTTPPTVLTDGQIKDPMVNNFALEGSAAVSDENGKLLFYTDGMSIWDQNHQVMPNGTGLTGHWSSSQAALIVRKPGSKHLYYVFTTDYTDVRPENNDRKGLRYTLVDMSLRNGLGEVISSSKNTLVFAKSSEKLTVVKHANNQDFWIIALERYNSNTPPPYPLNKAMVYLLSEKGLSLEPVVSEIGRGIFGIGSIGQMKASPDGKKIAVVTYSGGQMLRLFDFDLITGKFSNYVEVYNDDVGGNFGVEFSPNGKLVYITVLRRCSSNICQAIVQMKVGKTEKEIFDSQVILYNALDTRNVRHTPQIQLGNDGKIYTQLINQSGYLSVIHNPNQEGLACNFEYNAINLQGKITSVGLPNFPPYLFLNCRDLTQYTTLPKKKTICFGDSLFLDATIEEKFARYVWQDGSTGSTFVAKKPGIYNVKAYYYDCIIMDDTIELAYQPEIQNNLGEDPILAPQERLTLKALEQDATYNWSTGSSEAEIEVNRAGVYWLDISKYGCVKRDSIEIRYKEPFFPNVITPNGDGKNDAFEILKSSESEVWSMEIFNRLGKKVYESSPYQNDWKAENIPSGLYYYLATEATTQRRVKGWLQVLK